MVFANERAFNEAQKVWVPEFDDCDEKLWFKEDEVIDDGLETLGVSDPAKTIRLSKIFGRKYEHIKQVVIPPKLMGTKLSKKGPLGLTVQCYESLDELPTYVADIGSWPNTFGTPQ